MKTIRQIAEELGVSKQAVQKRIAREPLYTRIQPYISTREGTKYIEVVGENIIKMAFGEKEAQTNEKSPSKVADNEVVTFLMEQIKEKDRQLAKKDDQIADITAALVAAQQTASAAQALHAGTMQHQLVSSSGDDAPTDECDSAPSAVMEPPTKKRGFFGIFNKK